MRIKNARVRSALLKIAEINKWTETASITLPLAVFWMAPSVPAIAVAITFVMYITWISVLWMAHKVKLERLEEEIIKEIEREEAVINQLLRESGNGHFGNN